MIEDFYDVEDPSIGPDLMRIDAMLTSENLLKGLGIDASNIGSPKQFQLVTDVARAIELLQPIDLIPVIEGIDFEDFVGVMEEEKIRLQSVAMTEDASLDPFQWKADCFSADLGPAVGLLVRAALERHRVAEKLLLDGGGNELDGSRFSKFVDVTLAHIIAGFANMMVEAVHFGGLKSSRIVTRVLEGYETGGFPCGWVGPLPEDGGDPDKAVAVLHLGSNDVD